ncbi:hypothetical protein GW796_07990 [archaeon]|nr:hypothetical protein [archaeon]
MIKAKYIRIFSDIHLDFDIPNKTNKFKPETSIWVPPAMDTDKETILILAGDIWHAKKPFNFMNFSWFKKISEKFHSIIVILGNHDFWNGNIQKEYLNYQTQINNQNLKNVHLLQNDTIIIDNIKFIGGTLWTDYNNGNPISMQLAEQNMNDFRYIKNGNAFSKLRSTHIIGEHIKTKTYIENNSTKDYDSQFLWVLTHHLPTFKSVPSIYQNEERFHENGMYATNLENLFNENISAWVHGHAHEYQNYTINKTKILSNPRGYVGENTHYQPHALFNFNGILI